MANDGQGAADEFQQEVARLRRAGPLGESGRLLELFDFLSARGADAAPASQAEIAEEVFGQTDTGADDATVRVYIHRLRKRLEDYYQGLDQPAGAPRLTVPAGIYALRLRVGLQEDPPLDIPPPPPSNRWRRQLPLLAAAAVVLAAALAAFLLGRALPGNSTIAQPNALWTPMLESRRPTLIVLGDYYIFGEIDPIRPEEGRLIRDFRVNSATDLLRMQELMPDRFGNAEDFGLNYLPFSSAYGLARIVPMLEENGSQVSVLPASALEPDMLNYFDIVYVGLFSGMALLEDINFSESGFALGESYDELIDTATDRVYMSEEARRLASPAYYRDYGYVARFRAPGGALVVVVAGARDTGLRGLAPLVMQGLEGDLAKAAEADDFEALFQITGQQGADLSERLILARAREQRR